MTTRNTLRGRLSIVKRFGIKCAQSAAEPFRFLQWQNRSRRWQERSAKLTADYLGPNGPAVRKLQIGCGPNVLPDWLNSDIYEVNDRVIRLDATQPFPLPDAQLDRVFTEHVIEHIPYDAGLNLLTEAFRILKPGGRLRVATPDLVRILSLYTPSLAPEASEDLRKRYVKWSTDTHAPGRKLYTPAWVVNNFFDNWGHRFLYDEATLAEAMRHVGFENVTRYEPGKSDDEQFADLEKHQTVLGSDEFNWFETLVLEATKPV